MRWRNPPFQKVTLSAQSVANTSAVESVICLLSRQEMRWRREAYPEVVETA